MERHRIMVIGSNVNTVQRVSIYCLKKSLEVFPYYGIPTDAEVTLFAPHVLVLCLPMPEDFRWHVLAPYIFWSEQPMNEELGLVNTPTELYARLHEVFRIYLN